MGYALFTENRNMQDFVDLLSYNKITMNNIVTNEFNYEKYEKDYNNMIVEREEFFCGILSNIQILLKW